MFGTTEKLLFNLLSENNVMFGIKVIFDFRIKNHLMSEIYLCMVFPMGGWVGGGGESSQPGKISPIRLCRPPKPNPPHLNNNFQVKTQ